MYTLLSFSDSLTGHILYSVNHLIVTNSNLKQIYCCEELLFLYRDHHAPDMCDVLLAVSCLLPVNKCLTQERSKHHHPLLPAGLQPARPSRTCREPWSPWITRVHGSHGSPWEGWPRRERWSEGTKGRGRYLLTDLLLL